MAPEAPKATLVIGQPDLYVGAGCNHDATFQTYPVRAPASSESLCFTHVNEVSPGELNAGAMPAVDATGNLYVPDRTNNRVLRFPQPFEGLQQPDADRVWGQADFAGNLPNRGGSVSAQSLRLDDGFHVGVAIDWSGHLWVADQENHRVLRYPRCSGQAAGPCAGVLSGEIAQSADVVLGQSSCTASTARAADWDTQPGDALGRYGFPTDIAFEHPWCDGGSNDGRRCAADNDCIDAPCAAPTRMFIADNWKNSRPSWSRVLTITLPQIAVQSQCAAWDLSASTTPIRLQPSNSANRLAPGYCYPVTDPNAANQVFALQFDNRRRGLWIQMLCPGSFSNTALHDLDSPTLAAVLRLNSLGGIAEGFDLDRDGNAYAVHNHVGIDRYDRTLLEDNGISLDSRCADDSDGLANNFSGTCPVPFQMAHHRIFHAGIGVPAADAYFDARGITVVGDQIVHAEEPIMTIYNGYDGSSFTIDEQALMTGHPANDFYGQPGFVYTTDRGAWPRYGYPQRVQRSDREEMWVHTRRPAALQQFSAPLSSSSSPTVWPLSNPFCLCQSGSPCQTISVAESEELGFAVQVDDEIVHVWIADRNRNRVFRVRDFQNSNPQARCVDVVLGQPDATSINCNRGALQHPAGPPPTPAADTLCIPYDVALDPAGNVYVSDNGEEGGTNHRLLEWDATAFIAMPNFDCQTVPCFGPPANRVFGTGGNFNVNGIIGGTAGDPVISPFYPAFDRAGRLLITNNSFAAPAPRFPQLYLAPLDDRLPQLSLGDFTAQPRLSSYFDDQGNLFLNDGNNGR
ncbi:MAG TPA: hypothetical protein VEB21_09055, partial [Terriglobales bacterium]|nr:hypothetical protein [Terriglobales bacterium]